MNETNKIPTGSLFSGIGGIDLGFEREGFETKWFVEREPYCQAVLRKNFPGKPIYPDITKVRWEDLPKVRVLTGGFPCQDISIAGKGAGIEGERSGLWKYYAEAIRILRPEVALIENVPALTNRGLWLVLADLAKIGYNAEWFTLRAQDVGALHRRERIFIVANINNTGNTSSRYNNKEKQKIEQRWKNNTQPEFSGYVNITHNMQRRVERYRQETLQGQQGFSWCKDVRRIEDLQGRSDIPEPLIRRGSNGIPNRLDRIKCLGNAVVPQVAQFIARRIREIHF